MSFCTPTWNCILQNAKNPIPQCARLLAPAQYVLYKCTFATATTTWRIYIISLTFILLIPTKCSQDYSSDTCWKCHELCIKILTGVVTKPVNILISGLTTSHYGNYWYLSYAFPSKSKRTWDYNSDPIIIFLFYCCLVSELYHLKQLAS